MLLLSAMTSIRDSVIFRVDVVYGDMTVAEARDAWPGRVLSLNFPSTLHHAGEHEIQHAVERFLTDSNHGDRLVISLTEDFPPEVERKLFTTIAAAAGGNRMAARDG